MGLEWGGLLHGLDQRDNQCLLSKFHISGCAGSHETDPDVSSVTQIMHPQVCTTSMIIYDFIRGGFFLDTNAFTKGAKPYFYLFSYD